MIVTSKTDYYHGDVEVEVEVEAQRVCAGLGEQIILFSDRFAQQGTPDFGDMLQRHLGQGYGLMTQDVQPKYEELEKHQEVQVLVLGCALSVQADLAGSGSDRFPKSLCESKIYEARALTLNP